METCDPNASTAVGGIEGKQGMSEKKDGQDQGEVKVSTCDSSATTAYGGKDGEQGMPAEIDSQDQSEVKVSTCDSSAITADGGKEGEQGMPAEIDGQDQSEVKVSTCDSSASTADGGKEGEQGMPAEIDGQDQSEVKVSTCDSSAITADVGKEGEQGMPAAIHVDGQDQSEVKVSTCDSSAITANGGKEGEQGMLAKTDGQDQSKVNVSEGSRQDHPDTRQEYPGIRQELPDIRQEYPVNCQEHPDILHDHFPHHEPPVSDKPPYSYVALITLAIQHSPQKKLTLAGICKFICDHFPYYKERYPAWQKTISHNLSLNDCFIKMPWEPGTGKGNYWAADPQSADMFNDGSYLRRKKRYRKNQPVVLKDQVSIVPYGIGNSYGQHYSMPPTAYGHPAAMQYAYVSPGVPTTTPIMHQQPVMFVPPAELNGNPGLALM